MGVRSAQEGAVHAEQQFPWGQQGQQKGQKDGLGELGIPAPSFQPASLRVDGACPGKVGAQVNVIHAPCGDHRQDDVHDTLQRVVAQESSAGFEVTGEFSTLETFGFWDGHTPKTPPFVVPVRDRSHVHEFPVQHSLNLKMSATEDIYISSHGAPKAFALIT
ncbi:hypothetical protein QO006_001421 [Deinococcus enclensis]|uniref:Uncharacterized protein n=1 Tax=Deinococcus enclensis TaxID=1049582 RepID=A0ABT9MBN8_9DEIO|nr:hypothetical protein [Deinococcus enclensis]MDP9763996.1 hypothetical protein [Deinococcus enclensis]